MGSRGGLFPKKLFPTLGLCVLLIGIIVGFDIAFTNLNYTAAAFEPAPKTALDIPSDLNFIQDDKTAFLNWCETTGDSKTPLSIDASTYVYYGTIDGRRLYRMGLAYMGNQAVYSELVLGGHVFASATQLAPYAPGLYIIDSTGVRTLEQAYTDGDVDINKAWALYKAK